MTTTRYLLGLSDSPNGFVGIQGNPSLPPRLTINHLRLPRRGASDPRTCSRTVPLPSGPPPCLLLSMVSKRWVVAQPPTRHLCCRAWNAAGHIPLCELRALIQLDGLICVARRHDPSIFCRTTTSANDSHRLHQQPYAYHQLYAIVNRGTEQAHIDTALTQ